MGRRSSSLLALPISLLALVLQVAADKQSLAAVRKLSLDPNQKLFPEDLAFTPVSDLVAEAPFTFGGSHEHSSESTTATERFYYPAFGLHRDGSEGSAWRRAAEALRMLESRSSCPSGTSDCTAIGSPDKCCPDSAYCTYVTDSTVGHVACCPNGITCGGGVGSCPSDAVTCPSNLGGGCCIAGYVCEGSGCVVSALASQAPTTSTQAPDTVTTTQTTVLAGNPSTVIVTLTVTRTASNQPQTRTTTETVGPQSTETGTATGGAPFRPVSSSTVTPKPETSSSGQTQSGCPNGFYGCLATHGGGCCRTDRDCNTFSCPPIPSTTIVSDENTIVVPATGLPVTTTATCAGGWFMCGADAGPVAGCCPSSYSCGTASCFTIQASQTASVQKELPGQGGAGRGSEVSTLLLGLVVGAALFLLAQ